MRNFSHTFNRVSVISIDFKSSFDRLTKARAGYIIELLRLFETTDYKLMSPSEERVMDEFLEWFDVFMMKGFVGRENNRYTYLRSSDLPENTAFTYVNLNTGFGVLFTGHFDNGYGDDTVAAGRTERDSNN